MIDAIFIHYDCDYMPHGHIELAHCDILVNRMVHCDTIYDNMVHYDPIYDNMVHYDTL